MSRKKKLMLNTSTAFLSQIVALVCGFILPRFILAEFGSEINGLINSMTRFLAVISFLELGIGPVIQSNLYKPLAERDFETVSKIVASAQKFYRRIAYIFLGYLSVLAIVFPLFTPEFGYGFTASLLIIISISSFAQYFFGITNQVFLNADQKIYVHTSIQIVTVILNTVFSVILIQLGCGIHTVKLVTAAVFLIRPVVQSLYIRKHYTIDRKIQYTEDPIKQKWNGFAQHLASVISGEIDVILLTFFASYQSVSIYSVYFMVTSGITKIVMTMLTGLESLWGNMIVTDEKDLLRRTFSCVESLVHAGVTVLFTVTAVTVTSFIRVYTAGLEDSETYILPLFGGILAAAYGCQCLRVPYFKIIKAAGHYKQTQNGAFISMLLNIVLSLVLVFPFGLVGVAIGTLVAMLYHTVYFAWYLRRNILHRPFGHYLIHFAVDIVTAGLSYAVASYLSMGEVTYLSWILYACGVTAIVGAITLAVNLLVYHRDYLYLVKRLVKKRG